MYWYYDDASRVIVPDLRKRGVVVAGQSENLGAARQNYFPLVLKQRRRFACGLGAP